MPREIAERLATEIGKAVKAPALQARFNDLSFETVETTPAQFAKVVHDEIIKVGKVVKDAHISIEP